MKTFACDSCAQPVYFESVHCTRCGHVLAFLPDRFSMSALEPDDGEGAPGRYRALGVRAGDVRYRLCANAVEHGVCNWAVPADDATALCRSCRLNHLIPNLADPHAKEAWRRIESAKRRLLYTLLALGLPLETKEENPEGGLAFDFLASGAESPVFTGYNDGLITINIAEADDPFREKTREQLGETYRTVLGHFRHESGHYFWMRLIERGSRLQDFRALFGDEQASYEDAQKRHYGNGPPNNWWERFVSAYASMHPWEDWAESWAHYLHMFDGLESARAHRLSIDAVPPGAIPAPATAVRSRAQHSFDDLVAAWIPLTIALNDMNRSFGTPDCYPFVLTAAALDKLRFVHDVIAANALSAPSGPASRRGS